MLVYTSEKKLGGIDNVFSEYIFIIPSFLILVLILDLVWHLIKFELRYSKEIKEMKKIWCCPNKTSCYEPALIQSQPIHTQTHTSTHTYIQIYMCNTKEHTDWIHPTTIDPPPTPKYSDTYSRKYMVQIKKSYMRRAAPPLLERVGLSHLN